MTRFFAQHFAALRDALRRLLATPLNTVLSLIVIGSALALPSAGWVVIDNLRSLSGNASGSQQISIFMALEAGRKDLGEIETRLLQSRVDNWRFVSREEALRRLQATKGMREIIASLPKNPLPDAFIVEPADAGPDTLEALAKTFSGWPGVAHVQLDSAWVRRLDAFLRIGKLSVSLLGALFAGALVAVTFNTIRLQILAQSAEIEVARLIGATDAFIRRPFLYFGAFQGALGGLFAVMLVMLVVRLLTAPVGELIALYGGSFTLRQPGPENIAELVGMGAVLGWLGALLSVAIHQRQMDH